MSIATGTGWAITQWVGLGLLLVTGILLALRTGGPRFARSLPLLEERAASRREAQNLLIVLAVMFASWLGVQIVYGVVRQLLFAPDAAAAGTVPEPSPLETAAVPSAAGLLTFSAGVIALAGAGSLRSVGLTRAFFKRSFGPAFVGFAIMLPVVYMTAVFTQWAYDYFHVTHEPAHKLLVAMKQGGPWMTVLVILAAVVVAPLFEELTFRGLVQGLTTRFSGRPWIGVTAGAATFTVLHEPWTWPAIFLVGVCGGIAYERTKNLWVPILMHAAFNGTSVAVSMVVNR